MNIWFRSMLSKQLQLQFATTTSLMMPLAVMRMSLIRSYLGSKSCKLNCGSSKMPTVPRHGNMMSWRSTVPKRLVRKMCREWLELSADRKPLAALELTSLASSTLACPIQSSSPTELSRSRVRWWWPISRESKLSSPSIRSERQRSAAELSFSASAAAERGKAISS